MTEYTSPLRKKFIKSLRQGAVGLTMAAGTIMAFGNQFYELENHDWDMNASKHRMEALSDFDQGRSSLIEMQKENVALSRKFDKSALLWDENSFSTLKSDRDMQMDALQNRTTEYVKTILRSPDIHEKDAANLISQFNAEGLNRYSAIKNLTATKMNSRNEVRSKYGSDYGELNNEDYNHFVGSMDDSEKYAAMGFGLFAGAIAYIMLYGAFCMTGIPENWENLHDKPKKDKPKNKNVKNLLRKNKRLEN